MFGMFIFQEVYLTSYKSTYGTRERIEMICVVINEKNTIKQSCTGISFLNDVYPKYVFWRMQLKGWITSYF